MPLPFLLAAPAPVIRPLASWYAAGSGRNADGSSYYSSSPFVASRVYALGTRLRLTNPHTGRSLVVTVRDKTARGVKRLDLPAKCFRSLYSRHGNSSGWRVAGVMHLTVHVLGMAHRRRKQRAK